VFSSIGVCVIAHYCGGELEKVSLFSKPTTCCDGEEEESESNDCCKDDVKHVSFQENFTFYIIVSECKAFVLNLFILEPSSFNLAIQNTSVNFFLINRKTHPPNLVQQDLVSYSVIRI
jgi:hypothetical protein